MSPRPNRTMREILTEIPNKDIQSVTKVPGYLSATQSKNPNNFRLMDEKPKKQQRVAPIKQKNFK